MNEKQKRNLIRIIVSVILVIALAIINPAGIIRLIAYILVYIIVGYDILIKAFKGIKNGQAMDENLLMAVATLGAFSLALYTGSGDYNEAIAVMLFYQIGEWFQSYAVGKSRRNISELMDIAPDYANIEGENGELIKTDPDDVEPGTIIVVKPGERIPIDGVVEEGETTLDMAALTGESVPGFKKAGDEVLSGCINLSGVIRVRTTKEFGESTASRVMELIEDAGSRKSHSEKFISRFARVYTPAVIIAALALSIIPPLALMILGRAPLWGTWIYRSLTFLVISCPCALVVSIPLSFFAGIGCAGKNGILIKGSNYLEMLSETSTVVFDKTGTLTKGVFEVEAVHPKAMDTVSLLHIAAHAERHSNHPIAGSIREAYPDEADGCAVEEVEEIAGHGMTALVNGKKVIAGNEKLMEKEGVEWKKCSKQGTIIHVAMDGDYAGHIVIADRIKPNSKRTIEALRKEGIQEIVMLTGDGEEVARNVAKELGIEKVFSSLLPQDKLRIVEKLISEKASEKSRVVFTGDGLNDAPVLSRADIGVAMGALGSQAAIEAADVVLMDDDPYKLLMAIKISGKCMGIVKQNIVFAIGIKLLCLLLGALGIANMWVAIFADVGVMVIAVLNAMRCLTFKEHLS